MTDPCVPYVPHAPEVLIVGTGFAGLAAAHALRKRGIDAFVTRFGQDVVRRTFDEAEDRWLVETADGTAYRPRVLVDAQGPLHGPAIPTLPGIERFQGRSVHSAALTLDDTLGYGTGFVLDTTASTHLVGLGGKTIQQAWADHPVAYLGVAVAGFPNYFMLAGPKSGTGTQSLVFFLKSQARYIADAVALMRRMRATRMAVRPNVVAQFNRDVQRRSSGTSLSFRPAARVSSSDYEFSTADERDDEVAYDGPAVLESGTEEVIVRARLAGGTNPLDGRYHWHGRIQANPAAAKLKAARAPELTLRIAGRTPVPLRITEVDQWGHLRITGVGLPPYELAAEPAT